MFKVNKQHDSVRMMRSIRYGISREISGMTIDDEQGFIRQRLRDGSIASDRDGSSEDSPQASTAAERDGVNR